MYYSMYEEKNMQLRVILPTGADHTIEVSSEATIAELMITIKVRLH